MRDLSVIIPARCEQFVNRTAHDVLDRAEADTEVIVILDGEWAVPAIKDRKNLHVVHLAEPIGQRAATNLGVRMSQAKFVMKLDAHCSVGQGFDRILMEDCQYDWTLIPMLYNLHAFDWRCLTCGERTYQGVQVEKCKKCHETDFEMCLVWKPREGKGPYVSWRFDHQMQFQQWRKHERRSEAQGDFVETLSFAGPCFFIHRDRYWDLGGCDEEHGSWGQFGTEWACKTWLSGGKLVTTRRTWFAHMFRTGNFKGSGYMGSSFPYPISGTAQEYAKTYSRDLWLNNKWPGAKYPLSWLIEKFWPVPGWSDEDLAMLKEREHA